MRSYEVDPAHIMTEIYSYPFPEVRKCVDRLHLSARFMLNTLNVDAAAELLEPYGFSPPLDLPATAEGSLDLDELHMPVVTRIREQVQGTLPGLDGFEHAYPTPGSSHALFTLLAEWRAKGTLDSIAVIDGEYEGYAAYADSLQIPVRCYDTLGAAPPRRGEVWFVSNPSAADGNWIDKDAWKAFVEAGHDIVYDAAYAGLAKEGSVDVRAPNIRAVLTSPSKIFGVFRYRNTGVTYTRQPVAALYGTKWFKDIPALLDTLKLYETFGDNALPRQYRPIQERICQSLSALVGSEIRPSDALLLGHTREPISPDFGRFVRARGYRFGLTKLFEDYEAAGHGMVH